MTRVGRQLFSAAAACLSVLTASCNHSNPEPAQSSLEVASAKRAAAEGLLGEINNGSFPPPKSDIELLIRHDLLSDLLAGLEGSTFVLSGDSGAIVTVQDIQPDLTPGRAGIRIHSKLRKDAVVIPVLVDAVLEISLDNESSTLSLQPRLADARLALPFKPIAIGLPQSLTGVDVTRALADLSAIKVPLSLRFQEGAPKQTKVVVLPVGSSSIQTAISIPAFDLAGRLDLIAVGVLEDGLHIFATITG